MSQSTETTEQKKDEFNDWLKKAVDVIDSWEGDEEKKKEMASKPLKDLFKNLPKKNETSTKQQLIENGMTQFLLFFFFYYVLGAMYHEANWCNGTPSTYWCMLLFILHTASSFFFWANVVLVATPVILGGLLVAYETYRKR
jgi:hypothetical protein